MRADLLGHGCVFMLACLLLASCSYLVSTDEALLDPPDAGIEWCTETPNLPEIIFPRANSGVLGIVPVWGRARDCSGIDSVSVWFASEVGTTPENSVETWIDGELFGCYWDTSSRWVSESPWLRAAASPHRPTVSEQLSTPLRVTLFGFESAVEPSPDVPRDNWAFVDFDGDSRSDLLWNGLLLLNNGSWPFEPSPWAFGEYCIDNCAHAGCVDEADCCTPLLVPRLPLAVADFDGDGVLDLLHGGISIRGIYLARGALVDGAWTAVEQQVVYGSFPPGNGYALVSDVDLDGLLDIFLTFPCDLAGGVCITGEHINMLLMARTTLEPPYLTWEQEAIHEDMSLSLREGPAAAADILGDDGYPEIVISRSRGRPTEIYRNLGPEAVPRFVPVPLGTQMQSNEPAQIADFDLDGLLDIVFPFETEGQPPSLWRQQEQEDGVGFVDMTRIVGYPGGVLADINNDGLLDAGAALGTPFGQFVESGVSVIGYPVDVLNRGRNQALDFIRGPTDSDLSQSTLLGTDRMVVRVHAPESLPFNRFGIGTRIRIYLRTQSDDPDEEGRVLVGSSEIGAMWSGALSGFEVQFGTDRFLEYLVEVRLPMRPLRTFTCADDVPGNAVIVVTDIGGELECRYQ